jgi:glycosyltransferase
MTLDITGIPKDAPKRPIKFSVVTVCFNSASTIQQCVQSIVDQQDVDIEFIVIDGGSRDETLAKLASFKDRISVLVSERDKGIYDAMNKGLARATGDYVGFLNSDDFYSDNRALATLAAALRGKAVDAVFSDISQIDSAGRTIRIFRGEGFRRENLRRGLYPPHPGFYARPELLRRLGGFEPKLKIAGDFDLMIRFFNAPGVQWTYVPERIVTMRVGGASHSGIKQYLHNSHEIAQSCRNRGLKPAMLPIYGRLFRKGIEVMSGLTQGQPKR